MSAFAPIVLVDSVVGDRTFNPSAIDPQGVAKLYETASTFDERKGISLSVRLPKVGGSVARVTAKVVIPVMDSSTTPPKKIGECIGTCEFVLPKAAVALDRADILALTKSFLEDPSMLAAVNSLEAIY